MKKQPMSVAIAALLTISAAAFAEPMRQPGQGSDQRRDGSNQQDFSQAKQHAQDRAAQHVAHAQAMQSCVQAAADREALRTCRAQHRPGNRHDDTQVARHPDMRPHQ